MSEAYQYQLDIAELKRGLRPYLIDAMDKAGDALLRAMRINVHTTTAVGRTAKGAPGDPAWRNELDRDLRRLYEQMTDNYLEIGVGADYAEGSYQHVRAMVIGYGAGSAAGGEAIFAGPPGRQVWNDSLSGKKRSRSESVYDLPDGFNQEGNDFINIAIKDTHEEFQRIIDDAMSRIPNSVYMNALKKV